MLQLRRHLLSGVRAASSLHDHLHHHHHHHHHHLLLHHHHHHLLLSTTAVNPSPFVAKDFLVTRCGLTPAQALKSSMRLAHVKSPDKPEAVLAFLAGIGLGKADVATVIAKDPRLLCCKLDKTLTPRFARFIELGLSPPQICSLVTASPGIFKRSPAVLFPRLQFYLSLLGSCERVCSVLLKYWGGRLLSQHVDRVVKPNMAFLNQHGLNDAEIAELLMLAPIVLLELEHVKEIVECADKLGVPHESPMFKHALAAIFRVHPARVDAKLDFLKKTLGCSEDEVNIAVFKLPYIMTLTEANLSSTVKFLKMEVGLEPSYIVRRPAILCYSLKKRIMPRHFVIHTLKARGLLQKDVDFYTLFSAIEKTFVKRYLDPYKETIPGLAGAYAAAREAGSSSPPGIQL